MLLGPASLIGTIQSQPATISTVMASPTVKVGMLGCEAVGQKRLV